jgi:hypothetical protein
LPISRPSVSEPTSIAALPSRYLSKALVLAVHRDLLDSFGGVHGLRDEAALESALAQPESSFAGRLLHPGVIDQAAAYLFHLCMAHPFVDGNKRVALAAMDTFLTALRSSTPPSLARPNRWPPGAYPPA